MWHKRRYWGWYWTLLRTPWFCVKILKFHPDKQLSMQKHYLRKEFWIILWGKGEMKTGYKPSNGSEVFPGAVQYIPKEMFHQLLTADDPCYVLEFQWGEVMENDILRVSEGGVRNE